MKQQMSVIAMAMIFVMASCGASKKAVAVTDDDFGKRTGMATEVEVTFPCQGIDSDEEFLRVNGQGTSKDRAMARDRAYTNALGGLSTKLAGVASMETAKVAVSVNADGEEFHDKMVSIAKTIAQAHIAGYRTSCEKYTVNPSTGAYTCYCTIEFGKEKLVKEMYEHLSSQKLLKADYDFDRYLEMLDKDLKAYEEAHQ